MTKTKKIVGIMLLVVMLILVMPTTIFASGSAGAGTGASTGGIDAAGLAGELTGTASGVQEDVKNIGNQLVGIITTVGVVVAVIVLLVLGIKYMMGSASEKAEYKKTMIPYLVGAILIFGASAITKVVVGLASGIGGK